MKGALVFLCASLVICLAGVEAMGKYRGLEFLEPCSRRSPHLEACLARSANILTEHFKHGLPQLGFNEVEPIILDELHIALGGGPDGYRAQFRDVEAKGVSALRVTGLRARITDDEVQVQLALSIPRIRAKANYRSSGKLILVQASGAGDYWGEYEGVKAKVFIRAKPTPIGGRQYLHLQQLKMDFSVQNIKMGVENVHDGNTILQAALNLFINSNSQELLKEMKPDLRRKLVQVMTAFVEKLFDQVPYDAWIED
ncbi:protein takeout [Neodiprion pinetum]|uniref:Protein takeout n=1 Tax=Neodiprion lecontei TaxID=441921 RepID=A0A6J0CAN5_NEOLC|nr:protein takeout [Neodiprion lecontei]XP_046420965.1 protein takeout [Neodiprion fabricii]XP_046477415.1 protein takeout [Neodiprion pinetum]XP_046616318.1 protein takeout [Neodiprion virginianus]